MIKFHYKNTEERIPQDNIELDFVSVDKPFYTVDFEIVEAYQGMPHYRYMQLKIIKIIEKYARPPIKGKLTKDKIRRNKIKVVYIPTDNWNQKVKVSVIQNEKILDSFTCHYPYGKMSVSDFYSHLKYEKQPV